MFEMIFVYFSILLLIFHSGMCSPVGSPASPYPPSECGITNATIHNSIIGGGETEPGDWPWMANVGMICGGALVDSVHVLTAAHCVRSGERNMEVTLGDYMPHDGIPEIKRNVVKSVIHPGYKVYLDLPDEPTINDLAILTLDQPVPFSKTISPICLPEGYRSYSGEIATTIGYGFISPLLYGGRNLLRTTSTPIWDNKACQVRHDRAPILDSHLCFGEPGRGACHGDSGSPLMMKENGRWYHIGVTGWGRETCYVDWCGQEACDRNKCRYSVCDPAYPAVYAKVTSYLPWILENLEA